jgi:hypothetical protein
MATFDQTLNGSNSCKKGISASSATIDFDAQTVGIAETVSVFNLPANAVVTKAYFVVLSGVTGATATGKVTVGSTDAIAAVAFAGTAGVVKGGATTAVATGTGSEVTVTIGTAAATAGKVEVVVEYTEYTKTTGELTNV